MDGNIRIPQKDRIDLKTKICYSISSFGSYTIFAVFLNSVIIYYQEKLFLPPTYIFWAFTFYTILNAINGVVFGWISDRTKTSKGRRIPYLKYLAPFLAISFIFVWISPSQEVLSHFYIFLWMTFSMAIFDIFYTSTNLPYSALGQELSMDNKERANIQVFVMLFGIFSTLISLILPLNILEDMGRGSFILFVIVLAIIQLVTMWITAFTVKERLEFSQVDEPLGIRDSFKYTIKNKAFLTTVFVNFSVQFIQAVIFGNIFFYIFYVFAEYDSTFLIILIAISLLSGLFVGIKFTLNINQTKGLKAALIHSLIFVCLGLILIGIIPGIFAILGFFVFGYGLFGIIALINTAYGAVTDEDEVKVGRRREAAIFGIDMLITKPAQSIAGAFIAFILIAFQYQTPIFGIQLPQSEFTILGFRLAMGIIPGIIVFISLFIFKLFPLHGKYLEEIKGKMYKMHEEKRKKLKDSKIAE